MAYWSGGAKGMLGPLQNYSRGGGGGGGAAPCSPHLFLRLCNAYFVSCNLQYEGGKVLKKKQIIKEWLLQSLQKKMITRITMEYE